MNGGPKISVLVLCYNFERFIGECLDSLITQTLSPFEIIVADDLSTDASWAVIERYQNRYPDLIRGIRHSRNLGPATNGNFLRSLAGGDLITWLDGDDLWLPDKLRCEWATLCRNPEAKLVHSDVIVVDEDGRESDRWRRLEEPAPPGGDVFVPVFSKRFYSRNIRSIFRNFLIFRSCLDGIQWADKSLESYMDWDFKIRLTARVPVAGSGLPLVKYRRHPGGFSNQSPPKHHRALARVYEKNLPLLAERTPLEQFNIGYNIEHLIATNATSLATPSEQDHYSLDNVRCRLAKMLENLPLSVRRDLAEESAVLTARRDAPGPI